MNDILYQRLKIRRVEEAIANEEGEFLETIKMNKDFVAEMDKLTSHIQKTVTESVGSNLDGMDVFAKVKRVHVSYSFLR